MATNSFKSIHHHHNNNNSLRRRHSIDCPFSSSSFFLNPITRTTTSSTSFSKPHLIAFSLSSTTPTTPSTTPTTPTPTTPFDTLQQLLAAQDFRQADEETRRLLIVLAGEAAVKRKYVFFSEVQFIQESDLKEIDSLWRKYSDNKFGYSVQKKIWGKVNKDFTNFFIKVGWMKKLESSEVDQYNYRAFPDEFIWELNDETPEGHLPLTNALRGTQLLNSIFMHPTFTEEGEEKEKEQEKIQESTEDKKKGGLFGGLRSKLFKTDYSF